MIKLNKFVAIQWANHRELLDGFVAVNLAEDFTVHCADYVR